ncbi:FAD binding domain-containing protein [Aliivibrio kagoshimensis]|uniref:FAD binding domain-containing protein n=1 Tax=Aliivibrio kagoshimensis TaxID=2910230 RepID=UPI003D0C460B
MTVSYRPESLEVVLDKLAQAKHTLFAGGSDLMVQHSARPGIPPEYNENVIFLDAITSLKEIKAITVKGDRYISIGAGAKLHQIESDPLVPEILQQSVGSIAAPALRNRATLAGNICNASPAADSLPALYVLEALVILASVDGERTVAISDFITAPGKTIIAENELLIAVLIPNVEWPISFYHKVGTRAANALTKLSVVGVAKVVDDVMVDWRIAFGAVGPTVIRSTEIEKLLCQQPPTALIQERLVNKVVNAYGDIIKPIDDQRSTASYRHGVSLALLKRWLNQLADQ